MRTRILAATVAATLADANDKPVTDLTNTLKVEVTTGDAQPLALPMEPNFEVGEFGTPGDHRAFFIASSARTLAIVGLVVGVLGLVAGGTALARSRRNLDQTA